MTLIQPEELKLDNPVWYSLTEDHKAFVVEYEGRLKFYHPDYCPFGGFMGSGSPSGTAEYAKHCNDFFIVGNQPVFDVTLRIKKELICNQMVLTGDAYAEPAEQIIDLGSSQAAELSQLISLVQPGYFRQRTQELGSYYGIFKDGKMVAAAGERMKMNRYTEISAVVTHPSYTGRGYAKQLVAHAAGKILREGKIPYLHVAETNTGAIGLYQKLGFVIRRKISFWNLA